MVAEPAVVAEKRSTSETIEALVKIVGLLTAGSYIAGLLTINAYLRHVGVSDFSLIRPRSVYPGVLVLASITLAYLIVVAGYVVPRRGYTLPARLSTSENALLQRICTRDQRVREGLRTKDRLRTVLQVAAFLLIAGIPWVLFAKSDFFFEDDSGALVRGQILKLYLTALASGALAHLLWYQVERRQDGPVWHIIKVSVSAVLLATAFALYLGYFAHYIYPNVPAQFGGGAGRYVQLLLEPGGDLKGVQQLGISVSESAALSGPVHVLFESDDAYVLGVPDPRSTTIRAQIGDETESTDSEFYSDVDGTRVVQIDKKLVHGLVVVKGRPDLQPVDLDTGTGRAVGLSGALLHIAGTTTDACTTVMAPVVDFDRTTSTLHVTVLGSRPRHIVCGTARSHFERDIEVDRLEPGDYTVKVVTVSAKTGGHTITFPLHIAAIEASR